MSNLLTDIYGCIILVFFNAHVFHFKFNFRSKEGLYYNIDLESSIIDKKYHQIINTNHRTMYYEHEVRIGCCRWVKVLCSA